MAHSVVIVCYVLYTAPITVFNAKSICVMNLSEDHLQIFVFTVK